MTELERHFFLDLALLLELGEIHLVDSHIAVRDALDLVRALLLEGSDNGRRRHLAGLEGVRHQLQHFRVDLEHRKRALAGITIINAISRRVTAVVDLFKVAGDLRLHALERGKALAVEPHIALIGMEHAIRVKTIHMYLLMPSRSGKSGRSYCRES